jgi:hypothetical protein
MQVAESSGIVSKMTDVSLYTGAYKSRFNEDGTGKGLQGGGRVEVQTGLKGLVGR